MDNSSISNDLLKGLVIELTNKFETVEDFEKIYKPEIKGALRTYTVPHPEKEGQAIKFSRISGIGYYY